MHGDIITRLKPTKSLLTLALLHALADAAFACTLCHTDTGKAVRSGIFGPDFAFNILVTLIPFVIFLGITALIYFRFPALPKRSKASQQSAFSSGAYVKGGTL